MQMIAQIIQFQLIFFRHHSFSVRWIKASLKLLVLFVIFTTWFEVL